jgi:hypothetical protein
VRKVYLGKNFELRRRPSAAMERIKAEEAASKGETAVKAPESDTENEVKQ